MPTEYDNIDIIGTTHEISKDNTEKRLNAYYHKQEVKTLKNILKKMNVNDFESVIDLGCSIGTWYKDFKNYGFKKIIGIDISKERAEIAKKRGYNEVHVCNAYELPFNANSKSCVISNDVLIHVLQDDDKLRIFKEVKRILKKDGIFIFNIANANGFGYDEDTTVNYCRYNTKETITKLIQDAGFKNEFILPSYYTIPLIGAHPYLALLFTSILFPFVDAFFKKMNKINSAQVIYFGTRNA